MPRRGRSSRARPSAAAPPPASASSPAYPNPPPPPPPASISLPTCPTPPPPPPPLNAAPRPKIRIKLRQADSAPTSETLPPTSSQTLPPKEAQDGEDTLPTSRRRNPPRAAKRSQANAVAPDHQRANTEAVSVPLDVALSSTECPKIKFVTRHGEGAQMPRDEKLELRIKSLTFKGITNGRVGSGSDAKNLAVVYDEDMNLHKIPDYLSVKQAENEPEKPERLTSIMDMIIEEKLQGRFDLFKPDEVAINSLLAVHTKEHVKLVESLQTKNDKERKALAGKANSVYYSEGSTRAAFLAAGGAIKASTLVVEEMYKYAFAIVRPPGHHAGMVGPSGFCLFNNVAVAAKHIQTKYEKKRIVIVDFDVHHGNGTQAIFYDDRRVLVISIHRIDKQGGQGAETFPNTEDGNIKYFGTEEGEGFNVNCPLPKKGAGDADYFAIWEEIVLPLIEVYCPDLIFISAGFDAAAGDPIGDCEVTPNGYATLVHMLMKFSNLVLVLEGGYNLNVLAESATACIKALLGDKSCIIFDRKGHPMSSTTQMIKKVKQKLSEVWDNFKLDKERLQCVGHERIGAERK